MASPDAKTRPAPVLQPGRPADPVQPPATVEPDSPPAEASPPIPAGNIATPDDAPDAPASTDDEVEATAPAESKAAVVQSMRHRRRLLRQCERVLLLEFNTLAIPDWPDSYTVAAAQRRRDLWLFSAMVAALVFLSGIPGLVPAWVAGSGFGALVLIVLSGVPMVRRLYSARPSYLDLILRRQQRIREAQSHIRHLEGEEGLAWQCAMMAEFNPALRSPRFSALVNLSEKRILARQLRRRDHIRLYLIFMLESEKAYERLQNAYFEGHQLSIDKGWVNAKSEEAETPIAGQPNTASSPADAEVDDDAGGDPVRPAGR